MKIWHVGASASPKRVSGINISAWVMAREQALLGNQVTLILHSPPDKDALAMAEQGGFELKPIPANGWRYDPKAIASLLQSQPPDVVHMHSVFQLKHATLARRLVRQGIPYVIKPGGGLLPQILQRERFKKTLYSWLVEKRFFYDAKAVAMVTPREEQNIRAFVPRYKGIIRWMPNPVDAKYLEGQSWNGDAGTKRLVYLGRFDVLHKGIDILVEVVRHLPDVELHMYGTEDRETRNWFEQIKSNLPPNVHLHKPVYGAEKFKALADATVYIQTARWEVFGISIAEAMYLGTPCAIANTLNLAELFDQHDLGLVLPTNPQEAATHLLEVLNQPTRLHHWSKQAQAFAHTHFHPRAVALNYLKLYKEAIEG